MWLGHLIVLTVSIESINVYNIARPTVLYAIKPTNIQLLLNVCITHSNTLYILYTVYRIQDQPGF